MMSKTPVFALLVLALITPLRAAEPASANVMVGAARIDITPDHPIRLAGYQSRQTETTAIETALYARALAIGSDAEKPVVFLTVELVGVSETLSNAVAAELKRSHRLERAQLAVMATHVHSGPSVAGVLPFMFSVDLPAEEAGRIERYTKTVQAKLVEVARAALTDRKPGRLAWGEGRASFNGQRRVIVDGKWTGFGHDPKGQTDRALPVLRVTDERGNVRAVFLSYACHCTTLTGKHDFVHHDWAGDAAMRIEAARAGTVALVAVGCGADANPEPRGEPAHVAAHGTAIANEVERLLGGTLRPLGRVTTTSYREIELDLDHAVTRGELQTRLAGKPRQPMAYAATKFLQELDAGRALPRKVSYPVQTWAFGNDLAMVFLAGEDRKSVV